MSIKNSANGYGAVAQALHWLVAALIVTQFVLGQLAERAAEAGRDVSQIALLSNHKSLGMTILALAIVRLLWRFANPPPALPESIVGWQRSASHVSHWLLYLLLFSLPISGWLMSSAAAFTVGWFGLFDFPNLLGANESVADTLKSVHHLLADALLIVALVHIAAALKHHFIDKDDVLRRMSSVASIALFAVVAMATVWLLSDVGTSGGSQAVPARSVATESTAPVAQAQDVSLSPWQVDYAASTITFIGEQAGAKFDGVWRSWQAELRFDKDNLAASNFVVSVDIGSVNTESDDRDQTMMAAEWFDQDNHPTATFATEQVRANTDGSYSADALLTIKGQSARITFDFTVREDAGRQVLNGTSTVLDGESMLDRLALSLGTGDWADTEQVGQFVNVSVHVEAVAPIP